MKRKQAWFWYIAPLMTGIIIFCIIPFIVSGRYVFGSGTVRFEFAGTENIVSLFNNGVFRMALKNTISFILAAVPITVFASFVSAFYLNKSRLIQRILLLPLLMPVAAMALGWISLFGGDGIISVILKCFGKAGTDCFNGPYARLIFLLIYFVKNFGYMTFIFSGAMVNIPKEYREAFLIDSNSTLSYIRHVAAPLLSPVIFFVTVFLMVNCMQIFREIYLIYGDNPPQGLYMLQSFMNNNFQKLNYNRLCTAAFIVVLFFSFMVMIYLWLNKRRKW